MDRQEFRDTPALNATRCRIFGGPLLQWRHAGPRVLPLQAVGRRGRTARLLDDDRSGADAAIWPRNCGTRGSGCARPRRRSASSASTRRTTRSCSRAESCYFFVRPRATFLEVCVFLGRPLKAPQVRRVDRSLEAKVAHLIRLRHRDEVEAPITDWLQEAYKFAGQPRARPRAKRAPSTRATTTRAPSKRPQKRSKRK